MYPQDTDASAVMIFNEAKYIFSRVAFSQWLIEGEINKARYKIQ